jgi:hypothetical protein
MVSTTDRALQSQIRRGGFTVWFDPHGGSAHTFGVKYPIGMPGMPPPGSSSDDDAMMAPPVDRDRTRGMGGRTVSTDMELLGPDNEDRMIVSLLQEKQIQAKISDAMGGLTYELRVPLAHDAQHTHGIGVIAGTDVGLSLLTETMEGKMGRPAGAPRGGREGGRGGMRSQGGEDPEEDGGMMSPGGDGSDMGGGRGRGGMRGGPGSRTGSASPLDITVKVVLTK